MVAQLKAVLSDADRQAIVKEMNQAPLADGRMSAGPLGQDLKVNEQMDPKSDAYRRVASRVLTALKAHGEFNKAAIPRRTLPPIFARYRPGAFYGAHVDTALMGPFPSMRTDLSITIFLNDPSEYEGGTLCLETPFGTQEYRLAAGDAVLYPTHYLHWVSEVKSGERLAVVTWVESLVRDPARREVIGDLADLMAWAIETKVEEKPLKKIEKTRLNLLKMWADT